MLSEFCKITIMPISIFKTSSISNYILIVPFNTEHRYVRLGHFEIAFPL